jgi:hypothetical protein
LHGFVTNNDPRTGEIVVDRVRLVARLFISESTRILFSFVHRREDGSTTSRLDAVDTDGGGVRVPQKRLCRGIAS